MDMLLVEPVLSKMKQQTRHDKVQYVIFEILGIV